DRHQGHLRGAPFDYCRRHVGARRRAGHQPGARRGAASLLLSGGSRNPGGPAGRPHARRDQSRLFRDPLAMDWLNAILQGVLVGGLYALFATGLSLIFGVMRLVNIAHGDLIVLAAFLALVVVQTLGVHPLVALIIVVPAMAATGYGLQRLL